MNQVNLIGRATKDPELRYAGTTGLVVSNFTLAVDKGLSKDKKKQYEDQGKPTSDFIRIVAFGKQAEYCANFMRKGARVAVIGSISTSSSKSETGEVKYYTDINASQVIIIDWPDKQDKPKDQANDYQDDFKAIQDDEDLPW